MFWLALSVLLEDEEEELEEASELDGLFRYASNMFAPQEKAA